MHKYTFNIYIRVTDGGATKVQIKIHSLQAQPLAIKVLIKLPPLQISNDLLLTHI